MNFRGYTYTKYVLAKLKNKTGRPSLFDTNIVDVFSGKDIKEEDIDRAELVLVFHNDWFGVEKDVNGKILTTHKFKLTGDRVVDEAKIALIFI